MMEVDKKKTRTDEAWVRLYARFETDCLLPADAEHASATHRRLYLKWGERFGSRDCRNRMFCRMVGRTGTRWGQS